MTSSLQGIAFVTGAAQCIGRGIALRIAADGYDLGINDISSKAEQLEALKELLGLGRRAAVFTGDVSKEQDVKSMIDGVVAAFGGLDVVGPSRLSSG